MKSARLFLILGIVVFAGLQGFTLYHGIQANRKGGQGAGTGYIVASAIHLAVVTLFICYSVLSS